MSVVKSVCHVVHERSYNLFIPFGVFLYFGRYRLEGVHTLQPCKTKAEN